MSIFLGGTGSANELEDYEEGTWQPKISSGGSDYGTNSARYRKIGNFVYFQCDILNNSGGGLTQIFNLPFSPQEYSSFHIAWISNTSQGVQGASDLQGGLIGTDSTISFRTAGGNSTQTMQNNVRLIGHGSYATN